MTIDVVDEYLRFDHKRYEEKLRQFIAEHNAKRKKRRYRSKRKKQH